MTLHIYCTGLLRRVNLALASNTPVTTVTMAHISTKEPYRGVFDCLVRIWKEEGLRGFYRGGAPAMIIRDIPGYAMYFVPYAILCDMFKSNVTGEPNALGYIMAGGFAGVISWGSAHPMDTLKSRLDALRLYITGKELLYCTDNLMRHFIDIIGKVPVNLQVYMLIIINRLPTPGRSISFYPVKF